MVEWRKKQQQKSAPRLTTMIRVPGEPRRKSPPPAETIRLFPRCKCSAPSSSIKQRQMELHLTKPSFISCLLRRCARQKHRPRHSRTLRASLPTRGRRLTFFAPHQGIRPLVDRARPCFGKMRGPVEIFCSCAAPEGPSHQLHSPHDGPRPTDEYDRREQLESADEQRFYPVSDRSDDHGTHAWVCRAFVQRERDMTG